MKFDSFTNFITKSFFIVLYVLAVLCILFVGFELCCVICSRYE